MKSDPKSKSDRAPPRPKGKLDLRLFLGLVIVLLLIVLLFGLPLLPGLMTGLRGEGTYGLPARDLARTDRPAFRLRDAGGRFVGPQDFRGRFVFLYFGYTRCRESCPVWLARLLKIAGQRGDIQLLFVSIDPRDDEAYLRNYLANRADFFRAVPAGQPEIFALADQLGYRFDVRTETGNDPRHADAVYLFDRDGRLRLVYPFRWIDTDRVIEDLERLDREDSADPLVDFHFFWRRPPDSAMIFTLSG